MTSPNSANDILWDITKLKMINFLEEGWSIPLALKKAGVSQSSKMYKYYKDDKEFKSYVHKRFIKQYSGFNTRLY